MSQNCMEVNGITLKEHGRSYVDPDGIFGLTNQGIGTDTILLVAPAPTLHKSSLSTNSHSHMYVQVVSKWYNKRKEIVAKAAVAIARYYCIAGLLSYFYRISLTKTSSVSVCSF